MRLDVRKLHSKSEISVDNQTTWFHTVLDGILGERQVLKIPQDYHGKITVHPLEDLRSSVQLDLKLDFQLQCGLCLEALDWKCIVNKQIEFLDELDPLETESEVNLSDNDIEKYYLDNGELDLSQLVDETLRLELPSSPRHDTTKELCVPLGSTEEGEAFYKTEDGEKSNPFAALKKLKN